MCAFTKLSIVRFEEINWLKNLTFIRTSFCKNLHAKCYLNENECIITSLNLYEFSQVNNNEMGVLIYRNDDAKLYADTYEEAQRIIRISDEVRMSLEKVTETESKSEPSPKIISATTNATVNATTETTPNYSKLTTAKLAKELGFKTQELNDKLLAAGYLQSQDGELVLTDAGRAAGGTSKKGKFGEFCLWDAGMVV